MDPRAPAPVALAPREREGRGPRPPVVSASPRRRSRAWTSGAALPVNRGPWAL